MAGGIGAVLVLSKEVCPLRKTIAVRNDASLRGLSLGNAIRFHKNATAVCAAMLLGPRSSEPGMAVVRISGPLQGAGSQYQILQ